MNNDLKIIKKKYGEEMMHLCRDLFPTLLEKEGLLPSLLLHSFHESHSLAQDIISEQLEYEFKSYIYQQVDVNDVENNKITKIDKTPEELLKDAGYQLYECHTEEDIQMFKKYYAPGEELCTFQGGRLHRCHVFFVVKDNVDEIKREDFIKPSREDVYGTSVMSIQFTKDFSHTLSIKNRYNHRVNNPDSTFANNLDNIIPGLTDSFDKYYGMHQQFTCDNFELPGYVKANDGKYYKYNCEIGNVYYCEDNVIIDNFEVKEYPKEKYLVFDYFILDLQSKMASLYDLDIVDSFPDILDEIEKINIEKDGDKKTVVIKQRGQEDAVLLGLDRSNNLVSFRNNHVENIPNDFLSYNERLKVLEMENAVIIGDNFLCSNWDLETLELSNATIIGNSFLNENRSLCHIELPKVTNIGQGFLEYNQLISSCQFPSLEVIGNYFMRCNKKLNQIELPKATMIGNFFLEYNENINRVYLPEVKEIGISFLKCNKKLSSIELPKGISIGKNSCDAIFKLMKQVDHDDVGNDMKQVRQELDIMLDESHEKRESFDKER